LSASSTVVPRVKKAVQSLSIPTCQQLADEVLALDTASAILTRCIEVAHSHYAELLD
jgi:phosphoenolpyruvate-protein kinase (PTS system EI component)